MKNLNKIFYDILFNIDKQKTQSNITTDLLKKYFFKENNSRDEIMHKLADYLMKFENFCFDLDVNIMLNGSIDFKYR